MYIKDTCDIAGIDGVWGEVGHQRAAGHRKDRATSMPERDRTDDHGQSLRARAGDLVYYRLNKPDQ